MAQPLPPGTWVIGLEPWIQQDGNYGDFHVGQTVEFALELGPRSVHPTPQRELRVEYLGGCAYRVTAPIVFRQDSLWMLDAGVLAYGEDAPGGLRAGQWVSGEIALGIDPFHYFERHALRPEVPPAIHTWRIAVIRSCTAPLPPYPQVFDARKASWTVREVPETRSWTPPPGRALRYELVCRKLDIPPRRRLSRGW
ncbi:MAG TPA: hypothetical protein VFQ45_06530 [Longimicrobium sp.]|nr:hypothetical protein [Longimicrobium sp.]